MTKKLVKYFTFKNCTIITILIIFIAIIIEYYQKSTSLLEIIQKYFLAYLVLGVWGLYNYKKERETTKIEKEKEKIEKEKEKIEKKFTRSKKSINFENLLDPYKNKLGENLYKIAKDNGQTFKKAVEKAKSFGEIFDNKIKNIYTPAKNTCKHLQSKEKLKLAKKYIEVYEKLLKELKKFRLEEKFHNLANPNITEIYEILKDKIKKSKK